VEHIPEINLAEAALAELEGDTETVVEELSQEVAERTENAPRALIDVVSLSYGERKALSPDVPDLLASYEVESREGELGADLRQAEVTALSMMGQFGRAFETLEDLTERDGRAARVSAMEPLMTLLTENADDVTFLRYGLIFSEQATEDEAMPVAKIMARRLLGLGFAEQSQAMLMKLIRVPTDEERRLMMAEAALELNQPHQALVELMGMEGADANRLRAQALWQNGEYQSASEYLLEEQDVTAASRGFWHSENLDAISTAGDSPFTDVAESTARIAENSQSPEDLPPLANARALVESSVGTRDQIKALLQQVSPAPPEE
jgi:hypothetical protein